jgi:hypothetical protein
MSAVAVGCEVDDRTVICDAACERGIAIDTGGSPSGGTGGSRASGGASTSSGGVRATGGLSATGGSGATGGAATTKGGSSGAPNLSGGAATGGSSSGGVKDCSANVAVGTTPLIENFEDQDLNLPPNEGRSGYWTHLRSDTTLAAPPLMMPEGASKFMRVSGAGIAAGGAYPWAFVKVDFKGIGDAVMARSCVYDASKYGGVRFRARGVKVRVSLEMDLDIPVSNSYGAPGACTAANEGDCYDRRNVQFSLTSSWAPYQLLWEELMQQGFGAWHPVFSPARLVSLYFEVVPNSDGSLPAYQLDVDDVEFVR